MLRSYLTALPFTKFVLIEDSLEERGNSIVNYLVKRHSSISGNKINYFVFEGNFERKRLEYNQINNLTFHDNVSNSLNWIEQNNDSSKDFVNILPNLGNNDVIVIDSLAHVIVKYDLAETYRIFRELCNRPGIQQIIAVLHKDLIEENIKTSQYFKHLCSLSLSLEPKFTTKNARVHYTYKKLGGKVIKQIEEYRFENDELITENIPKPDIKKMEQMILGPQINPETLSTFRIGLSEKEKESRDQLILPYLPKENNEQEGGNVIYTMEDEDDWDEEDPDDDLDI